MQDHRDRTKWGTAVFTNIFNFKFKSNLILRRYRSNTAGIQRMVLMDSKSIHLISLRTNGYLPIHVYLFFPSTIH